jgi:Zn-dependent protease with chaperone function
VAPIISGSAGLHAPYDGRMRRLTGLVGVMLVLGGCATLPDGAYYPERSPRTTTLAHVLHRAAESAGDEPSRYSFAMIRTRRVMAFSGAEDGVFYFSDGLADLPAPHRDALVAREVAHEVLGHAGQRRALSIGLFGTFTVLGFVVPGLSVADWVANPLIVRAFSREQEIIADLRAVEILRAMGHELPRRTLASALREVEGINGKTPTGLLATFPSLEDRLAAIGPVESLPEVAKKK